MHYGFTKEFLIKQGTGTVFHPRQKENPGIPCVGILYIWFTWEYARSGREREQQKYLREEHRPW